LTRKQFGVSCARDRLIIALDVDSAAEAHRAFETLRDHAGMFKIGSQLFTAAGPELVRELVHKGARIFLDLKFHDIPNTVAAACREAVRLRVALFNVHAAGGSEMMTRAMEAVKDESFNLGVDAPNLIAVTALTSSDLAVLEETGIADSSVEAHVARLARLASRCGLDGVVTSPHEIVAIRKVIGREEFLLVVPGVRPAGTAHDDQRRVATPAETVQAGADYIVMGRAILGAQDPVQAAREIIDALERERAA
jgi:orotidine-5'-phosphate decarboxylase